MDEEEDCKKRNGNKRKDVETYEMEKKNKFVDTMFRNFAIRVSKTVVR